MVPKKALDNGYEVFTIVLYGETEILHKRYLNRMCNENRHPVHLSTTIDNFDDFKKCSEYLANIEVPGRSIRINTDDFMYQSNEEIIQQIDKYMLES